MWKLQPNSKNAATHQSPLSQPQRRTRVLFFAEAVTLAHAARPVTLARSLDPAKFDVHLAWDDRYATLFPDLPFPTHALHTIPSAKFLRALATGSPIYRYEELRDYVRHDRRIIEAIEPDVIVGDFRLSLSISAVEAKVPYLALANSYWSPFAKTNYPMPDHPANRILGRRIAGWFFSKIRPFIFARYAAPLNRLRIEHGLPSFGGDLRSVYTHGDQTLYADAPTLGTIEALPEHHHFIGPVHWSPSAAKPSWWSALPKNKPIIYLNLGSSGQAALLPTLLAAIASLDVHIIAATAGAPLPKVVPANVNITDYLPGDEACRLASLVICNGGSPATQQALAAEVPVLGIPSNLDQHLNMQSITRSGAGVVLLREHCRAATIQETVARLLRDANIRQFAQHVAQAMRAYDSASLFRRCLERAAGIEPVAETTQPTDGSPWALHELEQPQLQQHELEQETLTLKV